MNKSGMILNSYYASKHGSDAYVDLLVREGAETETYAKVPVMKIGGISMSLPPVGATGIIGFLNDNKATPFLIGFIDSDKSRSISEDDRTPRKPPAGLTR